MILIQWGINEEYKDSEWAIETTQWANALAANPDDLSLITETHMV